MSVNYNDQLSPYPNKGQVGQKEFTETRPALEEKLEKLTLFFKRYKGNIVLHTGAGVSTSAGIPDFRGPKGVWTLEKQNIKCHFEQTFDTAQPTFTHRAIKLLMDLG